MSLSIGMAGCSGTRIVYAGFARQPEEAQGAIRIATNSPIQVTVVGVDDFTTKMDLGGKYIISGPDLKGLIGAARKVSDASIR